jgi:hypothetical protein
MCNFSFSAHSWRSWNRCSSGELAVSEIRTKIQAGELTLQDCYFDPAANDWLTLESLAAEDVI